MPEVSANSPPFSPQQLLQEMSVAYRYQPLLLLEGEAGTGKATLARKLHAARSGQQAWLQEINCRCDRSQLEEFLQANSTPAVGTDSAAEPTIGSWQTTLLREVEALTLVDQQALLKRIEQTTSHPHPTERFLLTAEGDIHACFAAGRMRHELYYRLSMFRFVLPPLRQRPAELLGLTRHFVKLYADRYQKKIDRIDESLIRHLLEYRWPGNIRELQHVIERAVIYSRCEALTADDLPPELQTHSRDGLPTTSASVPAFQSTAASVAAASRETWMANTTNLVEDETLGNRVAETEREQIEKALQRNLQSRTRAARELGISRVTLYNKMKKLGLETHKPYHQS